MKTWLFYSLLTLAFWSVWTPMINYSTHALGNPFRVLVFEAMGFLIVLFSLPFIMSFEPTTPSTRADVVAFGAGFFAALGTLAIIYAFKGGGGPEIVTPLVNLSPALTVLWMWLFFGARLNVMQGLGVTMAVASAVIITRYSP
ncbi:MAG: EamA family transporter [Planctomycetota bacterium]